MSVPVLKILHLVLQPSLALQGKARHSVRGTCTSLYIFRVQINMLHWQILDQATNSRE